MKKRAKKKAGRKPGRRPGRPKGSKTARRGRPKGTGRKGKRGRPAGRKTRRLAGASMALPAVEKDLRFWNDFIIFLNANSGKSFLVLTDGKKYSLKAE